jgi:hypothetical protein
MKSTISQPMKSIFFRTALCGIVSLSVTSQWNAAEAAIIRGGMRGGRGSAPHGVRHNPAPAHVAHPNPVVNREAPRPQQIAPKIASKFVPNAAARISVGRSPIAIRSLEFVAHLRRELFSHRWSYVYAPSLNHAPKSIRFLQNGTVETEVKGERWYWQALDERRVSLRSLADANQPGITLEFNEGYTNFQYVLPNQTVAVKGEELNPIAEGSAASSSADGGPKTLEQALLSYQWNWNDVAGQSDAGVRFDKNKTFRVGGRTSFWNVTGPRTVHVEFENGEQTDLLFDTTFSDYTDGNRISGFRVTAESIVADSGIRQ